MFFLFIFGLNKKSRLQIKIKQHIKLLIRKKLLECVFCYFSNKSKHSFYSYFKHFPEYMTLAFASIVVVQLPSHVQLFATPWLQFTRPLCPSPSPEVCPNSCPLHLYLLLNSEVFLLCSLVSLFYAILMFT